MESKELTHLSLFSGIGGIDLAATWAGFRTVAFVENNAYCQKVLKKHWPDVPILEDIFNVTKETLADAQGKRINGINRNYRETAAENRAGNDQSNGRNIQRSTNTATIEPITLITGGFPCQPFSVAGKRRGKEDDRYLWPEMLRVIREVKPKYVVAENVAGLLRMGFDDCISDLERAGFTTESFIIPACAVNAPHRRDRIFIVGHSSEQGLQDGGRTSVGQSRRKKPESERPSGTLTGLQDVADTTSDRGKAGVSGQEQGKEGKSGKSVNNCETNPESPEQGLQRQRTEYGLREDSGTSKTRWDSWWTTEPELGRVAHGIPHRVDRLRALGNPVVPQQIYPILKAIADIERFAQ